MIEVLRAGLQTTVQDSGRPGYREMGVPPGGALDPVALRVANLLVGNPPDAAGLEITLTGPRLHFHHEALVALAGAGAEARRGGEAVPALRPVRLRSGETLEIGAPRGGCRVYLACAGGVDVAPVLRSRSTYLLGRFGGLEGRALRPGDRLPVGAPGAEASRLLAWLAGRERSHAPWGPGGGMLPEAGREPRLRLLPAAETASLDDASRRRLFTRAFRVGLESDRMGCRLEGPALRLRDGVEPTSEGVAAGTVQLPPGGAPIVLLADGGTTGGYPRIGHVATVDLPLLAQLRPGDSLRFRRATLDEAHRLLRSRERDLQRFADALRARMARL